MTQQRNTTTTRNTIIFGILGVGVVAILIAAVLFGGSTEELGTPEVTGALPSMSQASGNSDQAIGMDAPTVTGADFDGNQVSIANDGTAKVVLFLAHWCPHCQAEVPRVQAWLDQTGGVDGVDIYSVATAISSAQSNYPPSEWLDREGWTSPVIVDDGDSSALRAFGNGGFPYWVFTNSDGTVALRLEGEIGVENLQAIMESLS
jgi:cytochrome c biogenesis protein CcmG/thiol:disulfide interchange protein DsbE